VVRSLLDSLQDYETQHDLLRKFDELPPGLGETLRSYDEFYDRFKSRTRFNVITARFKKYERSW
jgi:hypothetical protein